MTTVDATAAAPARPASPFAVRGVIEGFYGRPWTRQQRLDMVGFIADWGMNTFVYGPKDDPLVRRDWRSPYEGAALDQLRELVDTCRDREIEFVYCLSPGLSIEYSNTVDIDALSAKYGSVATLGVRAFALLLDDIPLQLQHDADRAAFGDLAEAHAALVGRVFDGLSPDHSLVVCPTIYHGYGNEDYLVRLGAAIDPHVALYWTGRAICSATLDVADAEVFARAAGRKATYWDNYPVNDVAMNWELHIGPYRGRDPQLYKAATGIIANGMELFEASRIPLATIGDYLASPEAYDPEASWQTAIREVAGASDAAAFATFADNVRSSCLSAEDAPIVATALETFLFRTWKGDGPAAARDLATLAERLLAAADHLLRGPVHNPGLIEECRPWIEAFELGARALAHIARLAAEARLETDAHELLPYLAQIRAARVRIFGDAIDMTLADLTGTQTRPGRSLIVEAGGTR